MKKFNINDRMYIQITDEGWVHLKNTVGDAYINACIKTPAYEKEINGEIWYRLQCWDVFGLLPINFGGKSFFKPNVMFDSESIK